MLDIYSLNYFEVGSISEKAMAPHSSTFAWKIPWTEEPGRLQSMGSRRVRNTERLHFHALEKEMATHSSILAWRIPRTGEPGRLPSMGLNRVRHDWSDLAATAAGSICADFLKGFYYKWHLNFVKTFSESIDDHMVFNLQLLMWCIIVINLWILRNLASLQ